MDRIVLDRVDDHPDVVGRCIVFSFQDRPHDLLQPVAAGQRLRTERIEHEIRRVSGAGLDRAWGVANVGTRPTVDDSIEANLEVHLLDREIQLYGAHIEVAFRHKLREEQKFDSLESLQQHIEADIENTRAWFAARAQ